MKYFSCQNLFWLPFCSVFFVLTACQKAAPEEAPKSQLVQELEAIFYQDTFAQIPDQVFDVADYGAVGDGKTLNTSAIQQAIDAAAKSGGGKVIFPTGEFLSGALFIKSNVEFHLGEGVTLKAIADDQHYPEKWTRVAGIEMNWPAALINVYEEQNVRITGKGTIHGSGKYWWDKFWGDPPRSGGMYVDYLDRNIRWAVDYDCQRVRPVVVYKSERVLLRDVTVKQAGFWTISLTYSRYVHVDGLVIRNNIDGYGPSSDGINSDSSSDILVENCDIDCNDDNLCIKAGRDADGLRVNRPAENIVYRNCITRAGHGLFTIGSETSGGMRNVEVYGLEAQGTNTGIRFKSAKVRGGLIENIWFHDIKMSNVNSPFQFELNWYPEYSYPQIPPEIPESEWPEWWRTMTQRVDPPEKGIPEFRNITLTDIEVTGAQRAFYANAYPEKAIHDLSWKNVSIEAEVGGTINYAENWSMEEVEIKLEKQEPIQIQHSTNVQLPDPIYLQAESIPVFQNPEEVESQIYQQAEEGQSGGIAAMGVEPLQLMAEGDTAAFSESIQVYILSDDASQLSFYEPLGDGFYVSAVSISSQEQGRKIEIIAERNHDWTLKIACSAKPQQVVGAAEWSYDATAQQLIAHTSGTTVSLTLE